MADDADPPRRWFRPPTARRGPVADEPRPFGAVGRLRLFISAREKRTRRATDVLVLTLCAIGIALVGFAAQPPAGMESALIRFLDAFPTFLDGIWRLGWTLLSMWAALLLVLSVLRRRLVLARDLLISLIFAGALALLTADAVGAHASFGAMLRSSGPPAQIPAVRLALACSVINVSRPNVTRPFRHVGRWIIAFGATASVLLKVATPSGMLLSVIVGVAAGALVHLVFGSAGGRATLDEVRIALSQLGVDATKLEPAARQQSGVLVVRGCRGDETLVVKVYGRDAYDTQIVAKAWRALWYRAPGASFTLTRLQQVEHEAFLLLHAARHRVSVPTVVTAGATPDNDALLVLQVEATPLRDVPGPRLTTELLHRAWRTVSTLHDAGVVHGNLDGECLAVTALDDVVLTDLSTACTVATAGGRRADIAQLFVATMLSLDEARAVEIASHELGAGEFAATLPYLQDAALGAELRRATKDSGVDLDVIRKRVAASLGVNLPEPVRLRRVTRAGAVRALLLSIGAYALLSALGGLDLRALADALRDAAWAWIAFGLVLGQVPRLTQAASTGAASPTAIPFGPLAMLQFAICFINLAVPSTVGRVAVSVRFFQRQGLRAATAISLGVLDSVAGFVVQLGVLIIAFATGFGSLNLEWSGDSGSGGHRIIGLLVVVVLAAVVVVTCGPRWRHTSVRVARDAAFQVRETIASLTPTKVIRLLTANAATELVFALTLGVFVQAFGTTVPLASLLVVNVSAALLAGLMPVPGGIGVSEGALIAGLVAAGVDQTVAFAGVITYRLATFYLPPIWGAFAYRWLERNHSL